MRLFLYYLLTTLAVATYALLVNTLDGHADGLAIFLQGWVLAVAALTVGLLLLAALRSKAKEQARTRSERTEQR